ncbi:M81 family metallopeptidase [Haladaptatus sp. CMSO5]|uniref:M81 family metallopeptidase n=1 Tax=Haladaptatus sp. CMSO5 TaxID=3120514 RepID=UPI002FCE3113
MSGETVVVGRIKHETHTFSSLTTDYDEFAATSLFFGDEIIPEFTDTNTDLGGFLEVADEQDWEVVPTVAANATPGGIVTDEALASFLDSLVSGIEEADPDAVLLGLHGAMVAESHPDGDGYILERVREAAGDVPVMGTLDLHANISDRMGELADGLFGYDTYPHVDIGETGVEAAKAMAATLAGDLDPVVVIERERLLPPLPPLQTAIEPMRSLLDSASQHEHALVPDISVFGGYAYADVPEAGFSVVGVTDAACAEKTRAVCAELASEAWDRRSEFDRSYTSVEAAASEAAEWTGEKPLLLADISDNPGGGAAEDGTVLLDALLSADVENAALAMLYDPAAVEAAVEAGVGVDVAVELGGHTEANGDPLSVTGTVRRITDGTYRNRGPMSTGLQVSFGKTAVLDVDGVSVIVGSHRQQPYDPEGFRSQGITPEDCAVLVVKSTVHYRAGFEPLVGEIREVATPGMADPDLTQFTYEHVSRPMYPLDR